MIPGVYSFIYYRPRYSDRQYCSDILHERVHCVLTNPGPLTYFQITPTMLVHYQQMLAQRIVVLLRCTVCSGCVHVPSVRDG